MRRCMAYFKDFLGKILSKFFPDLFFEKVFSLSNVPLGYVGIALGRTGTAGGKGPSVDNCCQIVPHLVVFRGSWATGGRADLFSGC